MTRRVALKMQLMVDDRLVRCVTLYYRNQKYKSFQIINIKPTCLQLKQVLNTHVTVILTTALLNSLLTSI
jgi:hypothetical protein